MFESWQYSEGSKEIRELIAQSFSMDYSRIVKEGVSKNKTNFVRFHAISSSLL